jgi:hypothetical protein
MPSVPVPPPAGAVAVAGGLAVETESGPDVVTIVHDQVIDECTDQNHRDLDVPVPDADAQLPLKPV